ncbi:hypothetical protein U1Q18_010437 [Sarracenia purpurea var. burkii]
MGSSEIASAIPLLCVVGFTGKPSDFPKTSPTNPLRTNLKTSLFRIKQFLSLCADFSPEVSSLIFRDFTNKPPISFGRRLANLPSPDFVEEESPKTFRLEPSFALPLPLTNKALRIQRRNQISPLPFAIEAEIQTNKARAVHETAASQRARFGNSKQATEGLPSTPALGFDQSDDTEDYCNSKDLRRILTTSALLSRIKRKNCSNSSSKFPKIHQEDDSSYSYTTPSTNSYSRYVNGRDNNQLDFLGSQGFGINPLERTTPKRRGGCYSPSLPDILRRKGSSILCRSKRSSSGSRKGRLVSMAAQGIIPLLSDDELSMNFGELDLEALSRLNRTTATCTEGDIGTQRSTVVVLISAILLGFSH